MGEGKKKLVVIDFNDAPPQETWDDLDPDQSSIKTYIDVVFGYLDGFIPIRSFIDHGNGDGRGKNVWFETDKKDLIQQLTKFAETGAKCSWAIYVIPGTVAEIGQAKSRDVIQCQTILIDIDSGNTEQKAEYLINYLGTPTLIIESGGRTKDGFTKLHIYWQLTEPAEGDDIRTIERLRHIIAIKAGGDTAFQSIHQPIRIPGTVYHKHQNRRLVSIRQHNPVEYELSVLQDAIEAMPPMEGHDVKPLDFNEVTRLKPSISEALTTPIRAGSVDEQTRFERISQVIGYWIRRWHDGHTTIEQAWKEITDYNTLELKPPLQIEKIQREFNALKNKHLNEHGEPKLIRQQQCKRINILDWDETKTLNPAPREFLVAGRIPMKAACLFAAMGGAGKGMLTLDLAFKVSHGKPDSMNPPIALGGVINSFGRAVIFSAEDNRDEIGRRLQNLDPEEKRIKNPGRLITIPLPNCGGPIPVVVEGKNGPTVTPDFLDIKKQLLDIENLKLIVFDPLSSFVYADINKSNEVASFLMGVFASLAEETGAAVLLCHHMRKSIGNYAVNNPGSARDAIRGTTALIDGVRAAYAIWPAGDDTAQAILSKLNRNFEREMVYFGCTVKANGPANKDVSTFVRNEQTGLLEDQTDTVKTSSIPFDDLLETLKNAIAHAAEIYHPFMKTGKDGLYVRRHELPSELQKIGKHSLESMAQKLLDNEQIYGCNPATGPQQHQYLDVKNGQFHLGVGEIGKGAVK